MLDSASGIAGESTLVGRVKTMRPITATSLLALCVLAIPASASDFVLNFSGDICSSNADGSGPLVACRNASNLGDYNGNAINESYGDSAQANVTYKDLIVPGNSLRWWDQGYSSLVGITWGGVGDANGQSWDRIEIAPVGGDTITLDGFNLGAFPFADLTSNVEILDLATNAVLLDYGVQTIGAGGIATHFSPNISSGNGIAIEWRDTGYSVGIDNIQFSTNAVPEPSQLPGLAGALCLILIGLRRRAER
jgi:hypothetical protein